MFQKVVPVNKDRHAHKKIREVAGFGFAAGFHIAYLTMQEFARAASIFPIVFLEDKERNEFTPVALLGLDPGQNLFVGKDGKWRASYVPAIIRRYPFALVRTSTDGQYAVCIDEASSLVSDTEGAALFDEKGEPTQVINNVKRYLSELQGMDAVTRDFCKFLQANDLLTPLNMRVREASRVKNISGCHVVNEERLNALSDAKFLEFRNKRYLPAMYAHLLSLAQTERLVKLHEEASGAAAVAMGTNTAAVS